MGVIIGWMAGYVMSTKAGVERLSAKLGHSGGRSDGGSVSTLRPTG